jgi:nucleoside phosphorylase
MIHLVVALHCEARPLISRFSLEPLAGIGTRRPVYRGPETTLIVAGMGAVKAREATEILWRLCERPAISGWVNVGIAGHRSLPIGEVVLAERVVDETSGRSWRLRPPQHVGLPAGTVRTVSRVEEEFATQALYEMEAAGFCAGVCESAEPGRVQVLKIVSDNRRSGSDAITAELVEGWVERHLEMIERLVVSLRRRSA